MKRVAIFAHFSASNTIEDYVIYYLQELKKQVSEIIFASDSKLNEEQLNKIKPFATIAFADIHGEYDFGSYRRGFLYAKENNLLNDVDEVIFANDSCYAPLFSFKQMFDKMAQKECDFWGATSNQNSTLIDISNPKNNFHIQSYFICFKKHVFNDEAFMDFIKSITKENTKEDVIKKYEIGLSKLLMNKDFKPEVYSKVSKNYTHCHIAHWKKLIKKDKLPFLKRSVALLKNPDKALPLNLQSVIKKTEYDFNIIKKDIQKYGNKLNTKQKYKNIIKILKQNLPKLYLKQKKIIFLSKEYRI